ncbi:MAG: hypothetical protein JOZ37_10815 [Actinobacteria bacterium]|nr:hypothetical protein [Actinomycetota bacterium]MBV8959102.1 hypothetical protein [Actinomycetota bacterium]MBV9664447.1 hypothetical protein [Actinomycetota bacterium]MBV9933313.1 hypothetical protein [Actinomycetota bacterium]
MGRTRKIVAQCLVGATLVFGPLAGAAYADKPCNGCVGNADNKAPAGQSAGDKNHGYECDSNHGVGQGNPAHSGCDDGGPTSGGF